MIIIIWLDIKWNIFIIEIESTLDFIRNQKRSHSNDFKNVIEFILIFEHS